MKDILISIKEAKTDHPILDVIQKRWSPYNYSGKPVSDKDLKSIFEAARWAPSAMNEQPWYYIVAKQEETDSFAKILSCLKETNQPWAKYASVLMLGLARQSFNANGNTNNYALHDLGMASVSMCYEAASRGIFMHQMAGIYPEKAVELFNIPEGYIVATALTIGYVVINDSLDEKYLKRDQKPRSRRPVEETFFSTDWGVSHSLLKDKL